MTSPYLISDMRGDPLAPASLTLDFENLHSALASIQYSYGGFVPNEHRSRLQLLQSRIVAHATRTCSGFIFPTLFYFFP